MLICSAVDLKIASCLAKGAKTCFFNQHRVKTAEGRKRFGSLLTLVVSALMATRAVEQPMPRLLDSKTSSTVVTIEEKINMQRSKAANCIPKQFQADIIWEKCYKLSCKLCVLCKLSCILSMLSIFSVWKTTSSMGRVR